MGKSDNKNEFIKNQPEIPSDIHKWKRSISELFNAKTIISKSKEHLSRIFKLQERLALRRNDLASIKLERIHFEEAHQYIKINSCNVTSSRLLWTLNQAKRFLKLSYEDEYSNSTPSLINFILRLFQGITRMYYYIILRFWLPRILKLKCIINVEMVNNYISTLELLYYTYREQELSNEIDSIELQLKDLNANEEMNNLCVSSKCLLMNHIAHQFGRNRIKFKSSKDIWKRGSEFLKCYPIVLSSTFSARSNIEDLFDYVIMDEASQVGIETGLLALTCARNAVIVGDTKQLPNIVSKGKEVLERFKQTTTIQDCYDCTKHSMLSSVIHTIPHVPKILLREHYRCHPDIINFCNQKFYNGDLIIMTKRNEGENTLLAVKTAKGKHSYDLHNQREIDTIKEEIMPRLKNFPDTNKGIVAPYVNQKERIRNQIQNQNIEVDTIHKYQGREKDCIILTTVDDCITKFSDNPHMINVAVSRAKKKFCLVMTGNEQKNHGNLVDLYRYIKYQKGEIIVSQIQSIYDNMHNAVLEYNIKNGISKFPTENITFELLKEICGHSPYSDLGISFQYELRHIVRDWSLLTDDEIKYANNPLTQIDFVLYRKINKEPILAIEVDGYTYHKEGTVQFNRDRLKDSILKKCQLTLLRLNTESHSEQLQIESTLNKILEIENRK